MIRSLPAQVNTYVPTKVVCFELVLVQLRLTRSSIGPSPNGATRKAKVTRDIDSQPQLRERDSNND